MNPARLHPDDIRALARELAVQMRGDDDVPPIPDGALYATAEQLARRYQVSPKYVESRARQLGATPISDSRNSKLRYHLATADAYMADRRAPDPGRPRRAPSRRAKRPAATASGAPLVGFS